jgi:hypothetical protein
MTVSLCGDEICAIARKPVWTMSQRARISIVGVRICCQRAGLCIEDQGCAFGKCFTCLFVVLQRSARRRTNVEIGEKQAIN